MCVFVLSDELCHTGVNPDTGMCYWKSTSTMRFHSARWFCEDDGGELAFIKSDDSNSFLLAENMIEYVCNSMPYLLWCFSYVPRYILTTMM